MADRPTLACLGSSDIVERAVLVPNAAFGAPFEIGICARNFMRRKDLCDRFSAADLGGDLPDESAYENFDAVYIALPNPMHAKIAVAAAAGCRHVFVEKPACVDERDIARLSGATRDGGQIGEALMTAAAPWTARIAALVAGNEAGALQRVRTRIHLKLSADRRRALPDIAQGGGACFDLAPYWAQLVELLGLMPDAEQRLEAAAEFEDRRDIRSRIQYSLGGIVIDASFSHDNDYVAEHQLVFADRRVVVKDFLRSRLGTFPVRVERVYNSGETFVERTGGHCSYYAAQLRRMLATVIDGRPFDPGMIGRARLVTMAGRSVAACL